MPYTPEAKDMRQYARYKMDETEIHVKLAFANEVKIHDISLGGLSFKTDRRINIGKEYHLKLAYNKSDIATKGIVVWSLLSNSQTDSKGNVIPIYSCGLKFTNETKESEFIDLSVQFKEILEIFEHGTT
jgi:hypothetical protein